MEVRLLPVPPASNDVYPFFAARLLKRAEQPRKSTAGVYRGITVDQCFCHFCGFIDFPETPVTQSKNSRSPDGISQFFIHFGISFQHPDRINAYAVGF